MDKRMLVLEKPAVAKVTAVETETNALLEKETQELAEYAAKRLGYKALSTRVSQEKTLRETAVATAKQANSLPLALREAGIDAYTRESVAKYKKSMVRRGWLKFLLSAEECNLWFALHFIAPLIAASAFLCGVIGGWQSFVGAAVFQLPVWYHFWEKRSEYKNDGAKNILGLVAVIWSPIVCLGLAAANFGNWLLLPTYLVSILGSYGFVAESYDQLKGLEIYWERIPVSKYDEEIPLFALSKMRQIHQLCPTTEFYVDELRTQINLPDPFLVAVDPVTGKEFYIEVWDEKEYEAKYS
jgi:hypothetical protein